MRSLNRAFEVAIVLGVAAVALQVFQPEAVLCLNRVIGCLSCGLARALAGF